ncbi:MAG: NAD(P)/FAD-dependent oxidoreductase [Candidatus Hadarchaeum sp.]|uniref:NAD(P)/FAD-dependent oxidoreductase n=1 Tax=Candidatus Hadarchaeum sp. TaxID=2883567 RepID=UPI003D14F265
MPERWDVVVAGGGTAGLTAARSAALEGGKVLLLEMGARIGSSAQLASLIPADVDFPGKRQAVHPLRQVELHAPHRELRVKCNRAMIVDQRRLAENLAAEVAENRGEIWLNAPVKGLLVEDGAVRGVHLEAGGWSENIRCEVVIDATGARGEMSGLFLREVLKTGWNRELLAFSNEYLMANAGEGKADLFFDSYVAPGGHAWVYPLAKGFAASGIFGLRIHPDAALDEFLGRKRIEGLAQAMPIAATRGQLPLEGPLSRTCADGIIAVGGAAGHIYPLSGQGLLYSLRCGEIAGRVAIEAVTEGDVAQKRLSDYERIWRSEFDRDFEIAGALQSSLSVFQDQKMDTIVATLEGKPSLQRAFIDLWYGFRPESSMKRLLQDGEISKILGGGTAAEPARRR